jgi:hypothetical protein
MREKRICLLVIIFVMVVLSGLSAVQVQAQYVHPPGSLSESDFPQPPSDEHVHWRGPVIRGLNVQCWSAEPSTPSQFSGGVHGVQKVTTFVRTGDFGDVAHVDTKPRQKTVTSFSGGGARSDLKAEDIPSGIFISFKGHPIFKVTQIEYPISGQDPPLVGASGSGVKVSAEFQHEPRMGECYFYVAVWTAVK